MASPAVASQYWNREELYEDVWSKPLTALMAKYGVSAVAIGKNCHKLQVPLPGRGYWAKKQHGHPVKRKPLPKVHEIRRIERYQRPIVPATVPTPQPAKPQFPVEGEDKADVAQIDQMLASGAFVVIKPRKALRHALIVSARNILRKGFAAKQILQAPWNETCLDIQVSKTALSRALQIMAALISILEAQRVKVCIMPGDQYYRDRSHQTVAIIFGEQIQFGIREKVRKLRVPVAVTPSETSGVQRFTTTYEATGELSVQIHSPSCYFRTCWADTQSSPVESCIPECIASMMRIAVEHRRNTTQRKLEDFFKRLQWEELGRLKAQIDSEEARLQRLMNGANNWHQARRIREYVLAVVERRQEQGKPLGPETALGRWVIWALQQADRIDPLADKPESVLDRKGELDGWSPHGYYSSR